MNLGLGEESTAKIKLRMGLNLKSYKVGHVMHKPFSGAIVVIEQVVTSLRLCRTCPTVTGVCACAVPN